MYRRRYYAVRGTRCRVDSRTSTIEDAVADPVHDLQQVISHLRAVRVWSGSAYPVPPRKRQPGLFIQRVASDDALAELRTDLAIDPNHDDVRMMTWPTLTFELLDENEERLVVLGYIPGGWIRCDRFSDQPLTEPLAVERWLDRWIQYNQRT
jgi:hypothetical protein